MSFTAEGWAWKQDCPSSASKYVLVCLGWYANDGGTNAYPSIPTICKRTQLADKTVRKALADLLAIGLIEARPRKEGERCLSTEYRLSLRDPPLVNVVPLPPRKSSTIPPRKPTITPLVNLQGNPSLESPRKKERSLREREPAAAPPLADVDAGLDLRKQVFTEGCAIVQRRTGRMNGQARGLIGRFLNDAHGDAAIVLGVLHDADADPPGNFVSWVVAAIQKRQGRRGGKGVIDQIREDWGLDTLIAPDVFDDSVPEPDPARAIAWEDVAP